MTNHQPSIRQLASDVAELTSALDTIKAQLDTCLTKLSELRKIASIAANSGGTGDGLTLSGNIMLIRGILEREFGRT
jgi:uncharacterized protein YlxW (UPF0749 family)